MAMTIESSVQIDAPVERVFEVFTDLPSAADRISVITKIEMLTEGPMREGTRWRETRLMFKKEATEEMWVTNFRPNESYHVEAESCGCHYDTEFRFEPRNGGTLVTWSFTGTPLTFMSKLMAPMMKLMMGGMVRKCLERDLIELKAFCEGKSAGAVATA